MTTFVVITKQGPRWDENKAASQQEDSKTHHAFMIKLESERFLILGGPLGNYSKNRAMLIVNAANESEVRSVLAEDPWMRSGILRLIELYSWVIRYGELK
jgi:uncharacterized protein YciI